MRESDARQDVSSERPQSITRSEGCPLLVKGPCDRGALSFGSAFYASTNLQEQIWTDFRLARGPAPRKALIKENEHPRGSGNN